MPWVQIQKPTHATWSDYEKVQQVVGSDPPDGLIYHAAGEQPGGQWQAVSVWESEAHFNRFRDERLAPAIREALGNEMLEAGPPPSETFETKHVIER
jgi:hypothetical protein